MQSMQSERKSHTTSLSNCVIVTIDLSSQLVLQIFRPMLYCYVTKFDFEQQSFLNTVRIKLLTQCVLVVIEQDGELC